MMGEEKGFRRTAAIDRDGFFFFLLMFQEEENKIGLPSESGFVSPLCHALLPRKGRRELCQSTRSALPLLVMRTPPSYSLSCSASGLVDAARR
jgi:hypothetical protein